MRQSGLLLDDNRDVSEACKTRPLVEIEDHSTHDLYLHVFFRLKNADLRFIFKF